MRFRTEPRRHWITDRALVYRPEDYSFDIEPHFDAYASVVVNELSLSLDQKGKVVKVAGYCPYVEWRTSTIASPSASPLDVYKDDGCEVQAGLAWSVNRDRRWPICVDQQSGWVCLDSGTTTTSFAEIFPGLILGLDDRQELSAVYLKPQHLPKLK